MKRVGIICGGYSSEFDISVASARNIQDGFPERYKTHLVLCRKSGWTLLEGDEEIKMDISNMSFDLNGERTKLDAALIYIHGDPGENGKIQSYLEMIDLPYVNAGPLASQLSFDKWYCNQFLKGFDINVAKSLYLNDARTMPDPETVVADYGLPLFVKPCDSGSSYGIARVNTKEELIPAIENAFVEGDSVIVESFLDGTEVTCAAYRSTQGIQTLPLCEIVTENEFFDFEAKYEGKSQEIVPARISEELTLAVQKLSKEIYQLLNLRSIARVDYMIVDGVPYVIEVNSIPGFSNESIVPKMIKGSGINTKEFWKQILEVELPQ